MEDDRPILAPEDAGDEEGEAVGRLAVADDEQERQELEQQQEREGEGRNEREALGRQAEEEPAEDQRDGERVERAGEDAQEGRRAGAPVGVGVERGGEEGGEEDGRGEEREREEEPARAGRGEREAQEAAAARGGAFGEDAARNAGRGARRGEERQEDRGGEHAAPGPEEVRLGMDRGEDGGDGAPDGPEREQREPRDAVAVGRGRGERAGRLGAQQEVQARGREESDDAAPDGRGAPEEERGAAAPRGGGGGHRDAAEERVLSEEELEEDHRSPPAPRRCRARGGEERGEVQLHRAREEHPRGREQDRDEVHASQRDAEQLERHRPRHERRGEDEPRLHLAVDHRRGRRGGRELDERAPLRVLADEPREDEEGHHNGEREPQDAAEDAGEDQPEGRRVGRAARGRRRGDGHRRRHLLHGGDRDRRRGELPEEQQHEPARDDLRAGELAELLDEVGVHRCAAGGGRVADPGKTLADCRREFNRFPRVTAARKRDILGSRFRVLPYSPRRVGCVLRYAPVRARRADAPGKLVRSTHFPPRHASGTPSAPPLADTSATPLPLPLPSLQL